MQWAMTLPHYLWRHQRIKILAVILAYSNGCYKADRGYLKFLKKLGTLSEANEPFPSCKILKLMLC